MSETESEYGCVRCFDEHEEAQSQPGNSEDFNCPHCDKKLYLTWDDDDLMSGMDAHEDGDYEDDIQCPACNKLVPLTINVSYWPTVSVGFSKYQFDKNRRTQNEPTQ